MRRLFLVTLTLLGLISCKNESKNGVDVSNISVNFNVDRFEQQFYNTTPATLPVLKEKYPYLFPAQNPDSVWLDKISNKEELELFKQTQQVFGNFSSEKTELTNLFKHIKYYDPNFKAPKVITLITNLDFKSRVIYADSLLFVSLDLFLGKKNKVYADFPDYISQNFDKSYLPVAVAKAVSEKYYYPSKQRMFLEEMIAQGKQQFLIDCYLPNMPDSLKIGYSAKKYNWTLENEAQIWKYFVENKMLYSTDEDLYKRFISEAPFSKFYLDLDKQSPGSIGIWFGWQIVKSYYNNNNVTLPQLMKLDAETIFKNSKYKPKK